VASLDAGVVEHGHDVGCHLGGGIRACRDVAGADATVVEDGDPEPLGQRPHDGLPSPAAIAEPVDETDPRLVGPRAVVQLVGNPDAPMESESRPDSFGHATSVPRVAVYRGGQPAVSPGVFIV